MKEEGIYNDDYFSSFPDPLLSKKLLKFSEYPVDNAVNEQMVDSQIIKTIYKYETYQDVYTNGVRHQEPVKPIYYQGKRRSATDLKEFRASNKFPTFVRELEQCFDYLNHWITEQGITIELNERSALANAGVKSIPAQDEFNHFFTRLKNENFLEFDTDLFGDGKKYLEKLALLIRNNNIDLTYRKNQIISLLGEDGLRRCAGGCLTVLDNAVSNLENYGVYRPEQLIKRFFLNLLQQSAIHASKLHGASVISKISHIVGVDRAIAEIHIYNYLLQRAKRAFNLDFLKLAEDPLVSFITGPYNAHLEIKQQVDLVFEEEYLNPIKKKLRTADLVFFISNQLREKIETYSTNPSEKFSILELWLSELGKDPNFNREDFFLVNEDYKFQLGSSLEKTITERLFDSEWLELDMSRSSRLFHNKHPFFEKNKAYISFSSQPPFPFEAFKPSYRVYYSNLELSWIEIDGKQQRILDYIQKKDAFGQLQAFFQISPHILANSLIQTSNDMNLFFQALANEDLSRGLVWVDQNLSDGFLSPADRSVVWMYQFTTDAQRYAKILESVDSKIQKRLFLHLVERSQPFLNKLQTILNELVRLPSKTQTELQIIQTRRYEIIYEIFYNILKIDIKDFSGLEFPAFHCKKNCFFSPHSLISTYLSQINFSGCNLDNAVFNTHIKKCEFNRASMVGTTFKKSIMESTFKGADLRNVQFQGKIYVDLQLDGAKLSTHSFQGLLKGSPPHGAFFSGADLREVNFQDRYIHRELGKRVIDFNNAWLQGTDLSDLFNPEFNIVLIENANLDGAKLTKCIMTDMHIAYTSMRDVVTDQTVLRVDQLFQLYQQGNRDFSTDIITDSDPEPKNHLFNSETLTGARISVQIYLTLHNNGFKNFDQAQKDSIYSIPKDTQSTKNYHALLTSKSLKDRTQRARLERLELGQRKFQELQEIIAETLNHRQISKLHVLNQAELSHSYLFVKNSLEIQGQCVQLTAAFSEAIIRNKQAIYKNNLFIISEWDKRLIQHKPLSQAEQNDRNEFLNSLKRFEQSEAGPVSLDSWTYSKGIPLKDIRSMMALIDSANQEFAWHINLIIPNKKTGHLLGVYYLNGKYAYFDSNVGYIDNINDREIFTRFLKQIIRKSYLIHNNIKIYVDQYIPSIEFKKNPTQTPLEKSLFSILLTERQRLSQQDDSLGYLVINGQLIERTQLYDVGFSYHKDGNLELPGVLLDADMKIKQEFLDTSLSLRRFSINSHYFQEQLLDYIQEEKKSAVNPVRGKNKLNFDLRIMHALSALPNYQMLQSPISPQSLTPLFDSSSSPAERGTNLRSMEKLLKKKVTPSQLFTTQLEQKQFQKGLIKGLDGIKKKINFPKALGGLIITRSLFDIGISLSQNNRQAALLQSLMLSYGLFAEPWIEKSITNLPKKFAHFVNAHSSLIKISDKVLDTKKIVIPTRLFAGTAANVLDVVSLANSINKFMEAEYGSKDWRDAIADISIDSTSLITGAAMVVFQAPFRLGAGAGFLLFLIKSGYDGGSLLAEYSAYNLTFAEGVKTFFRGSVGLSASESVQYLRARQDQMDNLVKQYWENLISMNKYLSVPVFAYGGGLGEYITNDNLKSYQKETLELVNNKIRKINEELGEKGKIPRLSETLGKTNPGISAILPYDTPHNFKENLSRLIPKKPDEKNSGYLCLPAFRNESIEIENNIRLKKTISEVTFSCVNAVVIVNRTQRTNNSKSKKAVLNMENIYDGLIQKIPDLDNNFFIFNGTTTFFVSALYGSSTIDSFFIKSPYFSGNISLELETNSILILEDNSDIRTHKINLLPNKDIAMDVFSEKFAGEIQGKFNTKNLRLVIGRPQKQDKYYCQLSANLTTPFSMQLQGLGGPPNKADFYSDCLNVILHASSHYHLKSISNKDDHSGWGYAIIKVNADHAGTIVVNPRSENSSEIDVQTIHFSNLNLLKNSRLSYCHEKNNFIITKDFLSPSDDLNLETLRIRLKNYWNFEKKRSNYALYDQNDIFIEPLLNNDFIKSFKDASPINIAECFNPQKFLLQRTVNISQKFLKNSHGQDFSSLIEVEDTLEGTLYDSSIIGPFTLNPNIKTLCFVDIHPYGYALRMGNSDKNFFNLISYENDISSFYGFKDEDHYFINLDEISGKKQVKINNYDPETSIDTLEINTNHLHYELCIDQTLNSDNSFYFYILNRQKEKQQSPSTPKKSECSGVYDPAWQNVVVILLQNYLLSDVYQHIEICVTLKGRSVECFIPFWDKDANPKPVWLFKRYFRNTKENQEEIYTLDPSFSDIVVEGDSTRFQMIKREHDLLLSKKKQDGTSGYNSLLLWFPDYHFDPARWDLFHIYNTQNATMVHSRMRDLDNNFIREMSKIAVDYSLLENNLRFYELPLSEKFTFITHNQLQSNPLIRNRRDISPVLSNFEIDIGYLEISKNASYELMDIKVEADNSNLLLCIYLNHTLTSEINYYVISAENWDKPEYRLAGILYRDLSIQDLDQWSLDPQSIRHMQLHIYEKFLEHYINTIMESDLTTLVLWNKLRIFLLIPLPLKGYDIEIILNFMKKTFDFESIEEFLAFLPENQDSQLLIDDLKKQITQNQTLAQKIQSLLLYHVAKASFPSQENSKQIVIDGFSMVPESVVSTIYTGVRLRLINNHLKTTKDYMDTTSSYSRSQVELNDWLEKLSATSLIEINTKNHSRNKRVIQAQSSRLDTSKLSTFSILNILSFNSWTYPFFNFPQQFMTIDATKQKAKNLSKENFAKIEKFKSILIEQTVASSAKRSESWLNILINIVHKPLNAFQKFVFGNKEFEKSVFHTADAENSNTIKPDVTLDQCIPGVRYGEVYRQGITCYTKNMQLLLFFKNSSATLAKPEDTYPKQRFRPIEFNGRPAVYFEGEKTQVFYVPEIPNHPLEQLNEQLMLLQVVLHQGKKLYRWFQNVFSPRSNKSPLLAENLTKTCVSNQRKAAWRKSLDCIEKQMIDLDELTKGAVDLHWINYILEDRKEEFNYLNQLSEANLEKINILTENLQALKAELTIMLQDSSSNIKDKSFTPRTDDTDNTIYRSFEPKTSLARYVLTQRLNGSFFNQQSCNVLNSVSPVTSLARR